MPACCPPARGCNAANGKEPCVLELCREASAEAPEAALAVSRWESWRRAQAAGTGKRAQRFHRRSYERARDRAMPYLVMRSRAQLPRARKRRFARRGAARSGGSPFPPQPRG